MTQQDLDKQQSRQSKKGTQEAPENHSTLLKKVSVLPELDSRQKYSNWYLTTYEGSNNSSANQTTLYITMVSDNGSTIAINRRSLISILGSFPFNRTTGRDTYVFQECTPKYINGVLSRKAGSSTNNQISFKFLRVNFENDVALLYQNTFSVKPDTNILDKCIDSFGILMSYSDNFLALLPHLAAPAKKSTLDENVTFEEDV